MNNNIKKIANDVGIEFKPMTIEGVTYDYTHVLFNVYKLDSKDELDIINKFSELIVRECAKFIEENSTCDETNKSHVFKEEDLLKHFGFKNK